MDSFAISSRILFKHFDDSLWNQQSSNIGCLSTVYAFRHISVCSYANRFSAKRIHASWRECWFFFSLHENLEPLKQRILVYTPDTSIFWARQIDEKTYTYVQAKCHLTLLLFSLLLCVSRNFLASEFSNAWHRHRPHIPCELRHEHSHWYSSPCFIVDHA